MTAAFVIVVTVALLQQIAFTTLYWIWVPAWVGNPYGRMAQLDSWSRILMLSLFLFFVFFGHLLNPLLGEVIFVLGLLPLVFIGGLQLILLRRAVNSAAKEKEGEEA